VWRDDKPDAGNDSCEQSADNRSVRPDRSELERPRGGAGGSGRPGRIARVGSLTLSFDQIVVRGREYPLRGMATQVFESGGIREEVGTVGGGAGVGAVIGGLIGGVKGAVLGAVIGAGGAIAATEGKDVQLPAGAIVRIRLDSALNLAAA
jgi:hypothetical protein